jgi:hypothetical protein
MVINIFHGQKKIIDKLREYVQRNHDDYEIKYFDDEIVYMLKIDDRDLMELFENKYVLLFTLSSSFIYFYNRYDSCIYF